MKSTKISPRIQKKVVALLKRYPVIRKISTDITRAGGRLLMVGGAVRDLLMGAELSDIKDLDMEVYGLTPEQLHAVLKKQGRVSLVGKSFGVFRIHGLDIDWSLPRSDSAGRKPRVTVDPSMNISDAMSRRDLTINAMGIDLHTFELLDPWGGHADMKKKKLRAPNVDFFAQDPLRLFRVMQFMGRFGYEPDRALNAVCTTMPLDDVSRERIEVEFEKLLLKSKRPSLGIRWLAKIGRLASVLPELAATIGVEQGKYWHPEGDVFEHSMQSLDASARLPYEGREKLIMMYAALTHDLGKVTTTKEREGKITSYGHDQAGVACAQSMLRRLTRNSDVIKAVCSLVANHMAPGQFVTGHAKPSAYRRLAARLAPGISLAMLADLALADKQGRNPKSSVPLRKKKFSDLVQFLVNAQKAHVLHEPQKPVLQGADIADLVQPGPAMGALLKRAYDIQLDEGITDKQELKKRIMKKVR